MARRQFKDHINLRKNYRKIGNTSSFSNKLEEKGQDVKKLALDAVLDIVWPFCFAHYGGAKVLEINFTKRPRREPGSNLFDQKLTSPT